MSRTRSRQTASDDNEEINQTIREEDEDEDDSREGPMEGRAEAASRTVPETPAEEIRPKTLRYTVNRTARLSRGGSPLSRRLRDIEEGRRNAASDGEVDEANEDEDADDSEEPDRLTCTGGTDAECI